MECVNMGYKVHKIETIREVFKSTEDAFEWAQLNINEDEDNTFRVVKE
jgi:hypothetical protein